MKVGHKQFESQLENLRHESNTVAAFVFAEFAIHYRVAQSRRLLQRLNETPTLWKAIAASLQTSAYISLSRVFDEKSKYNLEGLLRAFEKELNVFQRDGLQRRKWDGCSEKPEWLDEYLDRAYYPTQLDVVRTRKRVAEFRRTYDRAVRDVRNQYFAHRQEFDGAVVAALFAKGKIAEICRLSIFLLDLHAVLQELYLNGKAPKFPRIQTSIASLFRKFDQRRNTGQSWRAHERIAAEVDKLMSVLERVPFTVR